MTIDKPVPVSKASLIQASTDCAILIVAAGFEVRARRVLELAKGCRFPRIVLVHYSPGVRENEENLSLMVRLAEQLPSSPSTVQLALDPRRPDEFLNTLKIALANWRPDATGEIWVDVSALPMQGICSALAGIRESLPDLRVRVLYTEAAGYFPTKKEVAVEGEQPLASLSQEMWGNLIPKHFGGSSSGASTCLIVFAGYEKHRSVGVVDELNPSKLVLVYGKPERPELAWRQNWSKSLHEQVSRSCPTAAESVSTLNPGDSLTLLNQYYGYLFADHSVAISPICSKMQGVASYLFWERYRDVQLVFPLPVSYLPKRFSLGVRSTFSVMLPTPSELAILLPSPL